MVILRQEVLLKNKPPGSRQPTDSLPLSSADPETLWTFPSGGPGEGSATLGHRGHTAVTLPGEGKKEHRMLRHSSGPSCLRPPVPWVYLYLIHSHSQSPSIASIQPSKPSLSLIFCEAFLLLSPSGCCTILYMSPFQPLLHYVVVLYQLASPCSLKDTV